MSNDTHNPDFEQETQNEEDESTEEESQSESTDDESSEDVDLKAENAKLKRLLRKKVNTSEFSTNSSNSEYDSRIERLELKQEGYSDSVIDSIMELGGKKVLKNPIVSSAVQGLVAQERNETASSVDGASQSSTRTKVSIDELKNMSVAEMEKHLPKD